MTTKFCAIVLVFIAYLSATCAKVPTKSPTTYSCRITGNVTCSIKSNGASCNSYTIPTSNNCFDIPVTYKFTYCNNKTIPVTLVSTKSYLKSEFYTYNFTNTTMPSKKCISQSNNGIIKSCSSNTYGALQLNGFVTQGSSKVWCFDYKYLKVQPKVVTSTTVQQSSRPTLKPSYRKTVKPISRPSSKPVLVRIPSTLPSKAPSLLPFRKPTKAPIISSPTSTPVKKSTLSPSKRSLTVKPTKTPSASPFRIPSRKPSVSPFRTPSRIPSKFKMALPTKKPTIKPTAVKILTRKPTEAKGPATKPTVAPTASICGVSVAARSLSLTAIVSALSNRTSQALSDSSSPQSLALSWLINEDGLNLCPGDYRIIQRFIVTVFYFSMNGDSTWVGCGRKSRKSCNPSLTFVVGDPVVARYGNATWLSAIDECKWGGLSCNDADGTLDRIEFNRVMSNKLQGKLPTEITFLTTIRFLIIESCCSPSIPKYNATNFAAVEGKLPFNLGNLIGLRVLDLSNNLLSGSVPLSILNIPKLKEIDLRFNNFIGQFPSPQNATQLSKLLYVHLSSNAFTGTVPDIGNAFGLANFTLQANKFTGQMPQAICNLIKPPTGVTKVLMDLWADCSGSSSTPAFISCNCCSKCFTSQGNASKPMGPTSAPKTNSVKATYSPKATKAI